MSASDAHFASRKWVLLCSAAGEPAGWKTHDDIVLQNAVDAVVACIVPTEQFERLWKCQASRMSHEIVDGKGEGWGRDGMCSGCLNCLCLCRMQRSSALSSRGIVDQVESFMRSPFAESGHTAIAIYI